MTDMKASKTIIPTEELRRDGNIINQTAQQIDPAGKHRVDVNANARGTMNTKQPGNLPQDALDEDELPRADEQNPNRGAGR